MVMVRLEADDPPPDAAAVPPPPLAGHAQDDGEPPPPSWMCHNGVPWIPRSQEEIDENLDNFFAILDFWDILYIFHLSIGQLATCAKILIRLPHVQDLRPPHIQQLITDFLATHEDHEFHDQERNELACMMDYLIKTKCNIMAIHRQLRHGDPRFMLTSFEHGFINDDFVDERGDNIPVADIYVYIPRVTMNRICQGTANQWWGDYRSFGGEEGYQKHFHHRKYLVGLLTGRIFDTSASKSTGGGGAGNILGIHAEGEVALHYSDDGTEHAVMRRLPQDNLTRDSTYQVRLQNPNSIEDHHEMKIHRLVCVLAYNYGLSVHNEGNIEDLLGLTLPQGSEYEDHITYRPLNYDSGNANRARFRALRVGDDYARDCDSDHRLGSSELVYSHGLVYALPLSHRLNTCWVYVRVNCGHWCLGLHISLYDGGRVTNEPDTSFVDRRISWDENGANVRFDGNPIEETNVFEMLPYFNIRYIQDNN